MHFTGIVLFAGQSGAMINDQRVKLGGKVGPYGAYILAKINAVAHTVTLRDRYGNLVTKASD